MKPGTKTPLLWLVIGLVLGASGTAALMWPKPTPAEAVLPESPSLRELSDFANENIWKEKKAGDGAIDQELLQRHALALASYLRGEPHEGFTRTVRAIKTGEFEEIRIRVFDDNGLFGGGYDFDFGSRHGQLKGMRFVPEK